MRIRVATSADVPTLMALERHAATAAHWPVERYEAAFSEAEPKRIALVIEEEAGVRGFLVARTVGSEWELENIAVAGAARRRGLGSRLLGELLGRARQHGATIFLEVRESNRAARSLYEKLGFVESGRRRRYYHGPEEDAIVYRWVLP